MIGFKKKENLYLFAGMLIFVSFIDQLCFAQTIKPKWATYKFNDPHFSIQSPFSLKVNPPDGTENFFCSGSDGTIENHDFFISVMTHPLEGKDKKIPLYEFPAKIQKGIFHNTEPLNSKTISKPVTTLGFPALLTFRTFETQKHTPMKIESLDVKREDRWFGVFVLYVGGNAEFDKMADKIINSFQILN